MSEAMSDTTYELPPAEVAERISSSLNSREYLEALHGFDEVRRDQVVGLSIEYMVLGLEPTDVTDYLADLQKIEVTDKKQVADQSRGILVNHLARQLGLAEINSDDSQRQLFDAINKRYVTEGYLYHGFNGRFEDSIRTGGLSTETRHYDWQDLETVQAILDKSGVPGALGWSRINSRGKISFAEDTRDIMRYANSSPEWFGEFAASGIHIPEPYDKNAYRYRDYEGAHRNVELFCRTLQSHSPQDIESGKAYPNITTDEAATIMGFFDKYWQEFAGPMSQPKLALIRRAVLGKDYPLIATYDDLQEGTPANFGLAQYMGAIAYAVDLRTSKDIPPESIAIADLPSYSQVHGELVG